MSDDTVRTPDHWARQRLLWGLRSVSPSERLLLLALNYHAGDSDEAWPSQRTLADELGLEIRQTRKLIAALIRRDWLIVRRGWPNRYLIQWDRLEESGTPVPVSPDRKRHSSAGPKRHSSAGLPSRKRHSSAIEHPACEHPKNTHGADAVSLKRNGWKRGGISATELRDATLIQARFTEAVESNYCRAQDRLRFFTLAAHVAQSQARSPGALFTRLLKAKTWPGTDQQEDQARSLIRDLDRQKAGPINGHATALAASLLSDFTPRRDHDD